jgi:predicted CopG family antitoxin
MNYVTTNIRIAEDDYLRLKAEAAKSRKSLSGVIREKLSAEESPRSSEEVAKIMLETEKLAQRNARYTKGFDSVKALREIRYEGK